MRSCLLLACALTLALGCDDTRLVTDSGLPPGADGGPQVDSGLPPGTDAGPRPDAGPPPPASPLVDPNCIDGQFTETLPDPNVDISDLEAGYNSGAAGDFVRDILGRRYSSGQQMVIGATPAQAQCPEGWLVRGTADPQAIYDAISVVVHECGHGYDSALGGISNSVYYINDSPLQLSAADGDTTDRFGMTFARSRIRGDAFQQTACPRGGGTFVPECDGYADIYLDGNPDDGTFEGGDQGFNSVLEETVQYVNSIAVSYAFTNELAGPGSQSERDGILMFLTYVMRYLRMARLDFPSAYTHLLTGDGGAWRRAILTVWGRAWLYLSATENMGHLGIRDTWIQGLVENAELLAEIQRLRDAEGCPAP